MLLKNGCISKTGDVKNVIDYYLNDSESFNSSYKCDSILNITQLISINLTKINGETSNSFSLTEDVNCKIEIQNKSYEKGIRLNFGVWDQYENLLFIDRIPIEYSDDKIKLNCSIPKDIMLPGIYRITIALDIPNVRLIELLKQNISFEIIDTIGMELTKDGDIENGIIKSKLVWH